MLKLILIFFVVTLTYLLADVSTLGELLIQIFDNLFILHLVLLIIVSLFLIPFIVFGLFVVTKESNRIGYVYSVFVMFILIILYALNILLLYILNFLYTNIDPTILEWSQFTYWNELIIYVVILFLSIFSSKRAKSSIQTK